MSKTVEIVRGHARKVETHLASETCDRDAGVCGAATAQQMTTRHLEHVDLLGRSAANLALRKQVPRAAIEPMLFYFVHVERLTAKWNQLLEPAFRSKFQIDTTLLTPSKML